MLTLTRLKKNINSDTGYLNKIINDKNIKLNTESTAYLCSTLNNGNLLNFVKNHNIISNEEVDIVNLLAMHKKYQIETIKYVVETCQTPFEYM